jgi:hypothetical protein
MREFIPASIDVSDNNDSIIMRNFYGLSNSIKDIQQSISISAQRAIGVNTVTLTGNVTGSGTGTIVTTIAPGVVTLAMQANLAANSIIGNNTGSAATPIALTASQTRTLLGLNTGDSPTFTGITISGLTAGRIPYIGASGVLSQGTLYWDSSNNRVGINASSPSRALHVSAGSGDVATRINAATGYSSYLEFTENNSTTSGVYWQIGKEATTNRLYFFNGSTRMEISSSGAVSIAGTLGVSGASILANPVRVGPSAATYPTKAFSVVGASFDWSSLVSENTSVDTVAHGRAFNFGVTNVSSVLGRFDLTNPGVQTIQSWHASGNITVGTTTDSGYRFEVSGTSRFTSTITTGLTASRTVITDGSSNLSVNTETGSGSHVRGTSPTISGPTFSGAITTALTVSLPVFTNASSQLTTNTITGSGSVMMSVSPTTTGTLTGAAANFSGNVSTAELSSTRGTFSIPDNSSTAFRVLQGSDVYISINTVNSGEGVTIGNSTINPDIVVYCKSISIQNTQLASFSGNLSITGTLSALSSFIVNKSVNTGSLSTSAGTPTSVDVADDGRVIFNVDPGVGNSSYVTLDNGVDGQVLLVFNDTDRYVYITNGSGDVNPLPVDYAATLSLTGGVWRAVGRGF